MQWYLATLHYTSNRYCPGNLASAQAALTNEKTLLCRTLSATSHRKIRTDDRRVAVLVFFCPRAQFFRPSPFFFAFWTRNKSVNIHSWSDVKWKSVSVARRWILRKACINGAKKKIGSRSFCRWRWNSFNFFNWYFFLFFVERKWRSLHVAMFLGFYERCIRCM